MLHISIVRSLYLSARFGGRIVVLRGTRLRLDRGARIAVAPGCRLLIGRNHALGAPASLDMRRNARLTVYGHGRVSIGRGAKILILKDAQVEIGGETAFNFDASVICIDHIRIGKNCVVSWHTNIFDGNMHELVVAGVPRPRTKPTFVGDNVWVGSGATVLGATIGTGVVVGTGSVVTSDVPPEVLVVGNPARVVRKEVSWRI
jgi:carbonic anhydrase/acetyltransferase-like protein (isoleucine patch superfamily)